MARIRKPSSYFDYTEALRHSGMSAPARFVCREIASHGGDTVTGKWCGDLAGHTGLAKRTIVRAKQEAIDAGWLRRTRSGRGGSSSKCDEFDLLIPVEAPGAKCQDDTLVPGSQEAKCQTDTLQSAKCDGSKCHSGTTDDHKDDLIDEPSFMDGGGGYLSPSGMDARAGARDGVVVKVPSVPAKTQTETQPKVESPGESSPGKLYTPRMVIDEINEEIQAAEDEDVPWNGQRFTPKGKLAALRMAQLAVLLNEERIFIGDVLIGMFRRNSDGPAPFYLEGIQNIGAFFYSTFVENFDEDQIAGYARRSKTVPIQES